MQCHLAEFQSIKNDNCTPTFTRFIRSRLLRWVIAASMFLLTGCGGSSDVDSSVPSGSTSPVSPNSPTAGDQSTVAELESPPADKAPAASSKSPAGWEAFQTAYEDIPVVNAEPKTVLEGLFTGVMLSTDGKHLIASHDMDRGFSVVEVDAPQAAEGIATSGSTSKPAAWPVSSNCRYYWNRTQMVDFFTHRETWNLRSLPANGGGVEPEYGIVNDTGTAVIYFAHDAKSTPGKTDISIGVFNSEKKVAKTLAHAQVDQPQDPRRTTNQRRALAASPGFDKVYYIDGLTTLVYNTATHEVTKQVLQAEDDFRLVVHALSRNGLAVFSAGEVDMLKKVSKRKLYFADLNTNQLREFPPVFKNGIRSCAIDDQGKRMVINGHDFPAIVFDVESFEPLFVFKNIPAIWTDISGDGSRVALQIQDINNRKEVNGKMYPTVEIRVWDLTPSPSS